MIKVPGMVFSLNDNSGDLIYNCWNVFLLKSVPVVCLVEGNWKYNPINEILISKDECLLVWSSKQVYSENKYKMKSEYIYFHELEYFADARCLWILLIL